MQTITATYPSELLSVFPLTAAVQRIALELAEGWGPIPTASAATFPAEHEALEGIDL